MSEPAEQQPRQYSRTDLYVRAARGLKLRDRKVTRLVQKCQSLLTWLEPSDNPALRAWCELEILAEQVFAVLRVGGVINKEGEGRRLLNDYAKLRRVQLSIAAQLGMTPAARMAISAAASTGAKPLIDLDALRAEFRDTESDMAPEPENPPAGVSVPSSAIPNGHGKDEP